MPPASAANAPVMAILSSRAVLRYSVTRVTPQNGVTASAAKCSHARRLQKWHAIVLPRTVHLPPRSPVRAAISRRRRQTSPAPCAYSYSRPRCAVGADPMTYRPWRDVDNIVAAYKCRHDGCSQNEFFNTFSSPGAKSPIHEGPVAHRRVVDICSLFSSILALTSCDVKPRCLLPPISPSPFFWLKKMLFISIPVVPDSVSENASTEQAATETWSHVVAQMRLVEIVGRTRAKPEKTFTA